MPSERDRRLAALAAAQRLIREQEFAPGILLAEPKLADVRDAGDHYAVCFEIVGARMDPGCVLVQVSKDGLRASILPGL